MLFDNLKRFWKVMHNWKMLFQPKFTIFARFGIPRHMSVKVFISCYLIVFPKLCFEWTRNSTSHYDFMNFMAYRWRKHFIMLCLETIYVILWLETMQWRSKYASRAICLRILDHAKSTNLQLNRLCQRRINSNQHIITSDWSLH